MDISIRLGRQGRVDTTTNELAYGLKEKRKDFCSVNTVRGLMKRVYIFCQHCNNRKALIFYKKTESLICKTCYDKVRSKKEIVRLSL